MTDAAPRRVAQVSRVCGNRCYCSDSRDSVSKDGLGLTVQGLSPLTRLCLQKPFSGFDLVSLICFTFRSVSGLSCIYCELAECSDAKFHYFGVALSCFE